MDDMKQSIEDVLILFEENGYSIERFSNIYALENALLKKKTQNISAIIIDLNLPSAGLKENLKEKTHDGKYTGWIWIWNVLFKSEYYKKNTPKLIIYSGYIADLKNKYMIKAAKKEKEFFENHIIKISKLEDDDGLEILNAVKKEC